MQEIIQELSRAIGINPQLVEGGLLTIALIAIVGLVRLVLLSFKNDTRQLSFEQRLVDLTASSVDESRRLREAYEKTVSAIQENSNVLIELRDAFKGLGENLIVNLATAASQSAELKITLEQHVKKVDELAGGIRAKLDTIQDNLTFPLPVTIKVRDEDGIEAFNFTVQKETDKDGNTTYVVAFHKLDEKEEVT